METLCNEPESKQRMQSRRLFLSGAAMTATLTAVCPLRAISALGAGVRYGSFRPGEPWLDTSGKPIQAHGASLIEVDGKYYWYGENKEFTTGQTDIWTWGVRCYVSSDLYNWEDLGTIIPPEIKDKTSPLHPSRLLDRPHILFNTTTQKFVCWAKLMGEGNTQTRIVLTAKKITGPYTLVRKEFRPLGMNAGDFDLAINPADGKGYMYFERVHSEMICADLTEDYTDFTGYYSTHFPRVQPPFVREGLTHCYRRGKHYLVSSGTTSFYPNPSEIAVAGTFHGPFEVLGDLHPGDISRTSFNSQISSIFKHPKKKDLYIALADRWIGPRDDEYFRSGEFSQNVQGAFADRFATPPRKLSPVETELMAHDANWNTSLARYVWLPISFDGERPTISWHPEWSLDDFE